jgi:hypothetical protein
MRLSRHDVHATEALCRRVFGCRLICDSSDEVCSSLMNFKDATSEFPSCLSTVIVEVLGDELS